MKLLNFFNVTLLLAFTLAGAETPSSAESEAAQRERLYQRFLKEMRQSGMFTNMHLNTTNADSPIMRGLFDAMVVHPSFGWGWDEIPAPTSKGTNAMAAVNAFIATNGWNMQTGRFTSIVVTAPRAIPISGLPWEEIKDRKFSAFTHDGILYVPLGAFGPECSGIAYNPSTNKFPRTINGFKPIGGHWYVWKQTMPPPAEMRYEGEK